MEGVPKNKSKGETNAIQLFFVRFKDLHSIRKHNFVLVDIFDNPFSMKNITVKAVKHTTSYVEMQILTVRALLETVKGK